LVRETGQVAGRTGTAMHRGGLASETIGHVGGTVSLLHNGNQMQTSSNNEQWLLTSRQAAEALAISERTLWELTNRGDMPCVRLGRSVRYDPADLKAWVQEKKSFKGERQTST